jgi:hypothetical protein
MIHNIGPAGASSARSGRPRHDVLIPTFGNGAGPAPSVETPPAYNAPWRALPHPSASARTEILKNGEVREPDVDSRRPIVAGLSTGHPTMRSYPGVRFREPRPRTGTVSPVGLAHACGERWPRPPMAMHGRCPRVDGHGPFGSCPASQASTSSMVHRPLDRGLRTQRSRPKRRSQMVYRSSWSTGRRCLSGGAPGIGFRVHLHSRVAWSLLTSQPSCSARHRFSNSRPARSTTSFPLPLGPPLAERNTFQPAIRANRPKRRSGRMEVGTRS